MNGFILKNDIMNLPIAQKKKKKNMHGVHLGYRMGFV